MDIVVCRSMTHIHQHENKAEWEQIPLREAMRTDVKKPVNVMADMDELLSVAVTQNFVPVVDDRGLFIGIVTTAYFFVRQLIIKLKFFFLGGRAKDTGSDRLPICVFSEGKRYWNVFKPVCDELEARHQKAVYLTCSEDDPALSAKY